MEIPSSDDIHRLTVEEFDSWWLDVNFEFRIPGSKRVGYEQMIGEKASFVNPVSLGQFLPGGTLICPLPFFYAEDSGFSLRRGTEQKENQLDLMIPATNQVVAIGPP